MRNKRVLIIAFCILPLVLLIPEGAKNYSLVSAQIVTDANIQELAQAVRARLTINYFQMRLEDPRFIDTWAWAKVFVYDPEDSQSIHNHSFSILAQKISGEWIVAFPGDSILEEWVRNLPPGFLSDEERNALIGNEIAALATSTNIYKMPYPEDKSYRVSSDWDDCRDEKCTSLHYATDFQMKEGDIIVAAAQGTVVDFESNSTSCGGDARYKDAANWIILSHSNGEYTRYYHFMPNSIPEYIDRGDVIQQGDVIGKAGHSGWTWPACAGNHLHFDVTHKWSSPSASDMREARFVENNGSTVHTNNIFVSQNTPPSRPGKASNLQPIGEGWYNSYTRDNTPSFTWTPGTGDNLTGYYIAIDDPTPDGKLPKYRDWAISKINNWTVPLTIPDGKHFVAIASRAQLAKNMEIVNPPDINKKGKAPYFDFVVDTRAPRNPTTVTPNCTVQNNVWQNTCNQPNFTWSGADDKGGVGIKQYDYVWQIRVITTPITTIDLESASTTGSSFTPQNPVVSGIYVLRLRTQDWVGNGSNSENWQDAFVLKYDDIPPTATLQINGGAATTGLTNVRLNLAVEDTHSGVAEVRISNNNITWTPWLSYTNQILWTLPELDRRDLTVYVQVRDQAGNEAMTTDTIFLDLFPPMPHSTNYRICRDLVDIGGLTTTVSPNYSAISSMGQPWNSGAIHTSSSNFTGQSGFLINSSGCLPITPPPSAGYTLKQSVINSGGNLRSNPGYKLKDSAGQPAASGENALASSNYVLSSGFWARTSGMVSGLSAPLTLIPDTPSPLSESIPLSGTNITVSSASLLFDSFKVIINNDDLYTNDQLVTIRAEAPNVTQIKLGSTPIYSDEGWQTYNVTNTFVISASGETISPVYVYAWFRDEQGVVYGTYVDEIMYDPVPPEAELNLSGSDTENTLVTLWIDAWDDNSGLTEMRLSNVPTMTVETWQPYTYTVELDLSSSEGIYAQFRDQAGNLSSVYGLAGETSTPIASNTTYLPLIIKQ